MGYTSVWSSLHGWARPSFSDLRFPGANIVTARQLLYSSSILARGEVVVYDTGLGKVS